MYRLEQMNEVVDLGLPEMLDDGGVTLIEWGDAIMPSLPADFLEVRLTFGDDDDERMIVLRGGRARLEPSRRRARRCARARGLRR